MIVTFQQKGHHQSYDENLRHWVDQPETVIPLAGSISKAAVNLGGLLRKPYFWKTLNRQLEHDALFFSYWDDVIPFYLSASYRQPLCPGSIGAIWMNTWGFRTYNSINVKNWSRYSFLNDESLTLGILDEGVYEAFQKLPINKAPKSNIFWMPDFTDTTTNEVSSNLENALKAFAHGRKILLCVGVLNEFKNLSLLKEVVQRLSPAEWVVAVLGEPHDSVGLAGLQKINTDNLFVRLGRVDSEATLNSLIAASALVWGAYKKWEGSSNIQIKAGHLGVPIITLKGYLMGERTSKYNLGLCGDETEILDWSQDNFRQLNAYNPNSVSSLKFKELFSFSSAKNQFLLAYQNLKAEKTVLRKSLFQSAITYLGYRLSVLYGKLKGIALS